MKRAMPWFIATVFAIAFAASFSELQRMRSRFGEVTQHKVHDHQDVRRIVIRAQLAETDSPIVIIGDSITEMAHFPERISGKRVINAGIGGATIRDYIVQAPKILDGSRPSLIVVAIGANDIGSVTRQADLDNLLSVLKPRAPILVVDLPNGPTTDGIHPTPDTSRLWAQSVAKQIAGDVD